VRVRMALHTCEATEALEQKGTKEPKRDELCFANTLCSLCELLRNELIPSSHSVFSVSSAVTRSC
jgi:hypothetical protein